MNNLIFSDLHLSKEVLRAVEEMGFEEATPIQSQAIPPIMEGKDVIGQAQTGTGKTCAFGIPAIERIAPGPRGIQVLVLCPTRELAIQTAEELKNVAKHKRAIQILPIYGGQSIERQISALRNNPQIIVGTPGRVMDHMRRNTLKLSGLKMMVLDEADEMLNMGFREDIDTILTEVPPERQTILFSATMPRPIIELTHLYQKEPVLIRIAHKELTVPGVEQFYLEAREADKFDVLTRLIDAGGIKLGLVFCNTKKRVDELAAKLGALGYAVEALHGDMKQMQRDKVMARFREGTIEILIATDVAARGIDVDNIEAVFNYDLPSDEEYYVHRIGRTGRAGKTGKAYSLVFGRELFKLKDIQRFTKSTIHALKPPSLLDVEESKVNNTVDKLKMVIKEGQHTKYISYIEKLAEENGYGSDPENYLTTLDIAAALLKMAVRPGNVLESDPLMQSAWSDNIGTPDEEGEMIRLFINAGRQDRVQPRHIIESITAGTSLPRKLIGAINIGDKFTFVDVPREYANEILTSQSVNRLNGRKINIERANRRPQSKAFPRHRKPLN